MKKFFILFMAFFFVSCDTGYVPIRVGTDYKTEATTETTTETTTTEETIVQKTLAPIDETIVYIWDDQNKRAYYASELPDGEGDFNPHPFLFTDGSVAEVINMDYYRPDRHWYFKVHSVEPVVTDGVTTGWNDVYSIFRQKDGVMEEVDSETVFPAYDPVYITDFKFREIYLGQNNEKYYTFYPTDAHGVLYGFCSYPFKYISMTHQSGDTLWIVAELKDVDHPQIFTMDQVTCRHTRWMDYARAVLKQ